MNMNSTSEQEFLNRLTEISEANLENEHFGVSELARALGMSRSNLHRKVRLQLKISASQFIKQARLKKGMELLRHTSFTVSEVAYKVGFGGVSYFIKCFHDYYGYSPGEVGNRDETETDKEIVKSNKKRLAVILSSVVLLVLVLVVLFFIAKPFLFQQNELEKTIAVLPFRNDSPDSTNAYINGLMESIVNNLSKIEDLDVRSRTSVEKYRESKMSLTEIAKDLKVNFIVEGSGQKIGDEILLTIQLLEAKTDRHLLSKKYRKEIKKVKDFIDLQNEIAFNVVTEIKAKITPEEKEQIKRIPTENLASWNCYLEGRYYHEFLNSGYKPEYVHKAKKSYKKSIELDSTYTEPYIWLAMIYESYLANTTNNIELGDSYLDSAFVLYKKSMELSSDQRGKNGILSKMYNYYLRKKLYSDAEKIEKQIKRTKEEENTPSYHEVMWANKYNWLADYYNMIKSYYNHKRLLPEGARTHSYLIYYTNWNLANMGYPEVARENAKLYLTQYDDSVRYFESLQSIEFVSGNFKTALDYYRKLNLLDFANTNIWTATSIWTTTNIWTAVYCFVMLNDFNAASLVIQKLENKTDSVSPNFLYGYVYSKIGEPGKAKFYYDGHLKQSQIEIKFNTPSALYLNSQFALASIYSETGKTEKAFEYLRIVNQRINIPLWILQALKDFPMFDNIRNEPEFQEILADAEAKYQKEHERVGELLREFGEIE